MESERGYACHNGAPHSVTRGRQVGVARADEARGPDYEVSSAFGRRPFSRRLPRASAQQRALARLQEDVILISVLASDRIVAVCIAFGLRHRVAGHALQRDSSLRDPCQLNAASAANEGAPTKIVAMVKVKTAKCMCMMFSLLIPSDSRKLVWVRENSPDRFP